MKEIYLFSKTEPQGLLFGASVRFEARITRQPASSVVTTTIAHWVSAPKTFLEQFHSPMHKSDFQLPPFCIRGRVAVMDFKHCCNFFSFRDISSVDRVYCVVSGPLSSEWTWRFNVQRNYYSFSSCYLGSREQEDLSNYWRISVAKSKRRHRM